MDSGVSVRWITISGHQMGNQFGKQRSSRSNRGGSTSSSRRSRKAASKALSRRSTLSEASPSVNPGRGSFASTTFSGSAMSEAPSSQPTHQTGKTSNNKYAFIPDNFNTLEQVTAALRESGLESSNLILGIDFTKSNEWTGKHSFNNRSLHAIGDTPNPYELAISIIGKTLAPFDEDNLIPCYGFGDATTHDQEVFSFHSDHTPCHGFEEVLMCYKQIVPNLRLSGPTSFGPIVEAAIDIVEKSGGQFHVLVIIADGQVTRSVDTKEGACSPQERSTIDSICTASSYPLAIVLVGVGDGPWDEMRRFDDTLPARKFDNFQFVNLTDIMATNKNSSEKETAFALAALMEIPMQYKATMELGIHGKKTGRAKKIVPRPPPVPYMRRQQPILEPSNPPVVSTGEPNQVCPICLTNEKNLAFGCGHLTCRDCGQSLANCPICRAPIRSRLRVYAG